jgi:hypothetical protein
LLALPVLVAEGEQEWFPSVLALVVGLGVPPLDFHPECTLFLHHKELGKNLEKKYQVVGIF